VELDFLHAFHLEDIQNPEHPSDFIPMEDHSILILRFPEIVSNRIEVVSYAFIVRQEHCYIFDRKKEQFEELGSLLNLNSFLDQKTNDLIKYIKGYYYEIDRLEDSLYDNQLDEAFMSKWLTFKKELSLIHRLIFDVVLSFELFITHHKRHASFEELAYADLHEHIERIRNLAKASLDKLDHLYDFYRAKVDEKMNRNVYYLTLLSGIFLPLTLISGFFGMNTGGLPYVNDPIGTWKVVGIALVLELIIFVPFFLKNRSKPKRYVHHQSEQFTKNLP